MVTDIRYRQICRYIQFAGIGLYLLFLFSCVTLPSTGRFYREAPCSPAEVISQLRQQLSKRSIGTTDPSSEGKGLAISTDSIPERIGKQDRIGKYKLVVQPVENANKSTITFQRVEGKSKGIRERKWYDDDDTVSKPPSEQQIWEQIQSICPVQQ